jgi:endonuclease-3 related protein
MGSEEPGRTILDIYDRLLASCGPQHWWPAEDPFEVMVGAVLTQSTAWTNVEKAINNLRASHALSPSALRKLSHDELASLLRPSGYYRVKARRLGALVNWLDGRGDAISRLEDEDTGRLREELLAVYGVGEETADSILLYAVGKPVFVIDEYTRRVVGRIGIPVAGRRYTDYQHLFADNLPANPGMFNEFHALLVRHGKQTCRKSPLCWQCCLLEVCRLGPSVVGEHRSTRLKQARSTRLMIHDHSPKV